METVIYKINTLEIVKITTEDVDVTKLKDDEDFMPKSLWLSDIRNKSYSDEY